MIKFRKPVAPPVRIIKTKKDKEKEKKLNKKELRELQEEALKEIIYDRRRFR